MGNFASKIFPQVEGDEKEVETTVKMSAIADSQVCTPVSKRATADPRSATVGIPRTPIEFTSTPPGGTKKVASAIPKYLRVKKYLETDLDLILPAITPEKKIPDPRSPNVTQQRTPIMVKPTTGYISPVITIKPGPDMPTPDPLDPRSPVTSFDRTPIARSKSSESSTPQTLTPDSTSPNRTPTSRISYCETSTDFNIPEIHSVSTIPTITITASQNLEERMKACELENPEDTDIFEDAAASDCGNSEESEPEDQITVIPNLKAMQKLEDLQGAQPEEEVEGTSSDWSRFPIETLSPIKMPGKTQAHGEKGKIRVWRDSVSPVPSDAQKPESEEIMIEFDDEILVKSKSDGKMEENRAKMQIVNKHIKKLQTSGIDARGVFEDVNVDAGRSRTPLACRSNKGIPGKSPQRILRAKGLAAKGQQENTPPNRKRLRSKTRMNGGQWDPDMSVVI